MKNLKLVGRNITGDGIKRSRLASVPKVTQAELAKRLAAKSVMLTQGQVAKLESGIRPVLDYELAAIAEVLSVPVADFFSLGGGRIANSKK